MSVPNPSETPRSLSDEYSAIGQAITGTHETKHSALCQCPACIKAGDDMRAVLAFHASVTTDPDESFDEIMTRIDEIMTRIEVDNYRLATEGADALCAALRYLYMHASPRHQEAVLAQLKEAGL